MFFSIHQLNVVAREKIKCVICTEGLVRRENGSHSDSPQTRRRHGAQRRPSDVTDRSDVAIQVFLQNERE